MFTDGKLEGGQTLTEWQQFKIFIISSWMYY